LQLARTVMGPCSQEPRFGRVSMLQAGVGIDK